MPFFQPLLSATIHINGKEVLVEWTRSAQQMLKERTQPLMMELELYFSCLIKKFVQFHDGLDNNDTVRISDNFHIRFRTLTSTACSIDELPKGQRQPPTELDTPIAKRLAPKRIRVDYRNQQWQGEYWL